MLTITQGYNEPTGFPLTKADSIDYLQFMADYAHSKGLAFGLKNGGGMVADVLHFSQWVIVEQCVRYDECEQYQPFIKANKPVFQIEYSSVKKGCNGPNTEGFSTLIKKLNLAGYTKTCPS